MQVIHLNWIFIFFNNLYSQTIEFRKDKVLIDEKECLISHSKDPNNIKLIANKGKQMIFLKFIRTGIGNNGGLYTKIIFVEQKKSLTSRSYIFSKKLLVKNLLEENVLNDCNIDAEKIDRFILKYDEKREEDLLKY